MDDYLICMKCCCSTRLGSQPPGIRKLSHQATRSVPKAQLAMHRFLPETTDRGLYRFMVKRRRRVDYSCKSDMKNFSTSVLAYLPFVMRLTDHETVYRHKLRAGFILCLEGSVYILPFGGPNATYSHGMLRHDRLGLIFRLLTLNK